MSRQRPDRHPKGSPTRRTKLQGNTDLRIGCALSESKTNASFAARTDALDMNISGEKCQIWEQTGTARPVAIRYVYVDRYDLVNVIVVNSLNPDGTVEPPRTAPPQPEASDSDSVDINV